MPKGLVIGGNSGIGEQFMYDAQNDDRFKGVHWIAPLQQDVDVRYNTPIPLFLRDHGPFRYIVYCAGYNKLEWIGEATRDGIENSFEVNVEGFIWLLSQHEKRYPRSYGSVVAISSDASTIPMRTSISYCASKAALNMAVRVAARELAPRWRINAIAPGIIDETAMTDYIDENVPKVRGWTQQQAREYEQSMIPLGRRGYKEEVSHVMRDLLFAPPYLTGSIIQMSGGK